MSKMTKMEDDHNMEIINPIRTSKIRMSKRTSKVKNCQKTIFDVLKFFDAIGNIRTSKVF